MKLRLQPRTTLRSVLCQFVGLLVVLGSCTTTSASDGTISNSSISDGTTAIESEATVTAGSASVPAGPVAVIRVPQDAATIQKGIDLAKPGDMVLVDAGVYEESVVIRTPQVTLRGVDRNTVILDGGDELENGVTASADGVSVENLTARRYAVNGVVFTKKYEDDADKQSPEEIVVKNYRASFITAYNNGLYGIYAFYARGGVIEHSYVSGHPDGGIYIGQCKPCDVTVNDVIGERNAQGFLGTNASGGVRVLNSTWRDNSVGVLVQSENIEQLAPQEGATISGNLVENNNGEKAPTYKSSSVGIAIGGGRNNVVTGNVVRGHTSAGIAVTPILEYQPERNVVTDNVLRANGTDLVLTPAGPPSNTTATWSSAGNCFINNVYSSSFPADLETVLPCAGGVSATKELPVDAFALQGAVSGVDYRNVTTPPADLATMPDPQTPSPERERTAKSDIAIRAIAETEKA
jgi:hypothetical protein